jgi:hypothetical protein
MQDHFILFFCLLLFNCMLFQEQISALWWNFLISLFFNDCWITDISIWKSTMYKIVHISLHACNDMHSLSPSIQPSCRGNDGHSSGQTLSNLSEQISTKRCNLVLMLCCILRISYCPTNRNNDLDDFTDKCICIAHESTRVANTQVWLVEKTCRKRMIYDLLYSIISANCCREADDVASLWTILSHHN